VFKKLLVPLDGSSLATVVLPHVMALAESEGKRITLLHVIDPATSAMTAVNPIEWHLRRTEAQAYVDEVAGQLSNHVAATVETVVLEGRAADQIVAYAQQGDCDLTVLSSHGQSGLTDWSLSSVTNKVIDRVAGSVQLVRADAAEQAGSHWAPTGYKRILVPLDGSLRAEYVLPYAKTLSQRHGAELVLVHVVAQPEMIQRTPPSSEQQALMEQLVEQKYAQATTYLETIQNRLDVPATAHVLGGANISAELNDFAAREAIDLVMITAHGTSGLAQRPYGSLASSLLAYGVLPVIVLQDMAALDDDTSVAPGADEAGRKPGLWNLNRGNPFTQLNSSALWRHSQLNRRPLQFG
jgi:nucleotide-binding universal stress UspA family protein